MTSTLSLLSTSTSGTARAIAVSTGPQPDKESLRAEHKAVADQKLQINAVREQARSRSPERSAYHAARLENMQKALTRLMAGHGAQGPAVVAVQTPSASFAAVTGAEVTEVSTGAADDAVAVQGAVVNVRTDEGADAVTVEGTWVSVSTDDDAGNFGPTRYFSNADAVAISARHAVGIHTGGGDDAIAIVAGTFDQVHAGDGNDRIAISAVIAGGVSGDAGDDDIAVVAETGMFHEPVAETDIGRATMAAWADGSATGRMARSFYASAVGGGDGNDRIAVSVADTMGIRGGAGNDTITATGGTFALHFAAGDGQDFVHLAAGAEAVVMLDASLTDDWSVEHGDDTLTLRWGAGLSVTFQGLGQAGAIGVSRTDSKEGVTLIHSPAGLNRTV